MTNKYVQATIIHGKESRTGNYKLANKNFKIADKYYNKIKSFGEKGYNEIIKLLTHENGYVRVGVAYRLLPIKTELAKKVLNEFIGQPDGVGFNAEMILSEWELDKNKLYQGFL